MGGHQSESLLGTNWKRIGKLTIDGGLLFWKTPLNYDSLYDKQLIIPKNYREKILRLSRDVIFYGHTSKNKCMAHILNSMFWPGLSWDVTAWCRSCEVCQKQSTWKTADRAPLQPLPLIGEPMSDIECDVMGGGPPRSQSGKRYVLNPGNNMCY